MEKKYEVSCYVGSEEDRKTLIMNQRFDSYREEGSYTHFIYNNNKSETIIPTRLICNITVVKHCALDGETQKSESRSRFWSYINEKEKWDEVEDQLETADFIYNNSDIKNKFMYRFFIKPLVKRYEDGERTDDLYIKIMNIEM